MAAKVDEYTSNAEEILIVAAAYAEAGHCTGVLARDAEGNEVDYASPLAVSWCALGAISAASDGKSELNRHDAEMMLWDALAPDGYAGSDEIDAYLDAPPQEWISDWSDGMTDGSTIAFAMREAASA